MELLKSRVGIIMPTCDPHRVFTGLLPTVKHIKELAGTATWLINFNGPQWGVLEASFAASEFERLGFECRYKIDSVQQKPANLISLREECAWLDPEVDLYLFVDDDFKFVERTPAYPFSSGQRYLHSIDYMTRFQKCGVINTKSFLGGWRQKLKIVPSTDDMYATNRGLFLRNMSKHGFLLAPKETHNLVGGLEETLMVFARIERGYFCAKQMTNPTIHITGVLEDYDDQPDNFHNIGLINSNIGAYLRGKYDNWEWKYSEKKFPQALWEAYASNGGPDIKAGDERHSIDYAEYENWG